MGCLSLLLLFLTCFALVQCIHIAHRDIFYVFYLLDKYVNRYSHAFTFESTSTKRL